MNAGMFGHPGGMAASGARSIIQYGSQIGLAAEATSTIGTYTKSVRVASAAAPISVRTRLYGAYGKGACKFFAIDHGGTSQTITIEIVVDGVNVRTQTVAIAATPSSALVVGFYATSPTFNFLLDYIPFSTSFEIFVTNTTSSTALNYIYNVDAHQ